jgi:transcriptional regulator with XRE-family HTH domain
MTKRPHEADIALGRRLKSLRVRRGLSQTELGMLLGVSFQQIQKYENATNRIRVSQLWRIAEALGVPVTELLEISRAESSEVTDMIDTRTARLNGSISGSPVWRAPLPGDVGRGDGGARREGTRRRRHVTARSAAGQR